MLHAIVGLPGAGKSYFAVRMILAELQNNDRVICTNLALHLDLINEYLQAPEREKFFKSWHHGKIRIIDDKNLLDPQVARFWQIRSSPEFDNTFGQNKDTGPGVVYFIDEIQLVFGARDWAKRSGAMLEYLSQHRKLGDDVYWITQAPSLVDKQIRSLTQDYTYLRNLRYEKFFGFWRRGEHMWAEVYLEEKQRSSQTVESYSVPYDLSVMKLYDTAAGVRLRALYGADSGKKAKGWPWWTLWLGAILLIVGGILAIHYINAAVVGAAASGFAAKGLNRGSAPVTLSGKQKGVAGPPSLKNGPLFVPSQTQDKPLHSYFDFKKRQPPIDQLKTLFANVTLLVDSRRLWIVADNDTTQEIMRVCAVWDNAEPEKRIVITALMLDTSISKTFSTSFQTLLHLANYASPAGLLDVAVSGSGVVLTGDLQTLTGSLAIAASRHEVNVISSPQILVTEGQPQGSISSGLKIPVANSVLSQGVSQSSTQYIDASLDLQASYIATGDGGVVKVVFSRKGVDSFSDIAGSPAPTLVTSSLTTTLPVKSNTWYVLGGVSSESDGKNKSGIFDLPILDSIFGTSKTHQQENMIILLNAALGQEGDIIKKALPVTQTFGSAAP